MTLRTLATLAVLGLAALVGLVSWFFITKASRAWDAPGRHLIVGPGDTCTLRVVDANGAVQTEFDASCVRHAAHGRMEEVKLRGSRCAGLSFRVGALPIPDRVIREGLGALTGVVTCAQCIMPGPAGVAGLCKNGELRASANLEDAEWRLHLRQ